MKHWAKFYHKAGFFTVPVRNKRPLNDGWQDKAITLEDIEKWMGEFELGILTGPVNGLFVLDVDAEGHEQIKGRLIPFTPTVKTKNGGLHMYFKWDARLDQVPTTLKGVLPGVDTRGKGGQVVCPPSSGYAWLPGRDLTIPLAPPPEWLISLLLNRKSQGAGVGKFLGDRHPEFIRLASRYFNDGLTEKEVEEKMREWNETMNGRPFDEARFKKEMDDIARPWKEGRYVSYKVKEIIQKEQAMEPLIQPTPVGEFMKGDRHINWLVDRIIPKQGCALLAGEFKIGKSWLMMDLALEIARGGGKWLGEFPVSGGKVLYIDEENAEQLLRFRLHKLVAAKAIEKLDLSLLVGKRFQLDNPKCFNDLRRILADVRPTLVCGDAFVRFHRQSENDSSGIAYVNSLIKSLMQEFGCTFLFTDHEPKAKLDDNGEPMKGPGAPRGSGDKIAFSDSVISVRPTKTKGHMKFYHTYSRWGVGIDSFDLELTDIDVDKTVVRYLGGE